MTVYRPEEDKTFNSKSEMFERIVSALGGRVAEKLMIGDISTGAGADIQQASAIARAMVTVYGMSERLGPISFDDSSHSIFIGRDFGQTKSYSEKTAALIDDEVKRIFDEAMELCEKLLTEHKDMLIATAEYLLKNETMEGADFIYMCSHNGELPPEKLPEADDSTAGKIAESAEKSEDAAEEMPDDTVSGEYTAGSDSESEETGGEE